MSKEDLIKELQSGVVKFYYRKSDGSIREAFGTLKPDLIPTYDKEKVENLIRASMTLRTSIKRIFEDHPELDGEYGPVLQMVEKALKPFEPKEKREGKKNETHQIYYDFGAKGFRLFNPENLVDENRN